MTNHDKKLPYPLLQQAQGSNNQVTLYQL